MRQMRCCGKPTFYKYNVLVALEWYSEFRVGLLEVVTGNNIGRSDINRHICMLAVSQEAALTHLILVVL